MKKADLKEVYTLKKIRNKDIGAGKAYQVKVFI